MKNATATSHRRSCRRTGTGFAGHISRRKTAADAHLFRTRPQIQSRLNKKIEIGTDRKVEQRHTLPLTRHAAIHRPGWGTLGVIFHDLYVRLKVPDPLAGATKLGKLDWHRSASIWSDLVRKLENSSGKAVLGLAAGGAQTRRT